MKGLTSVEDIMAAHSEKYPNCVLLNPVEQEVETRNLQFSPCKAETVDHD